MKKISKKSNYQGLVKHDKFLAIFIVFAVSLSKKSKNVRVITLMMLEYLELSLGRNNKLIDTELSILYKRLDCL